MSLKFTILGCGNSSGVPASGNYWGKCDPAEPKNKRTRPSLWVQSATTSLVIDTGPDFRQQTTQHNIDQLDAVLYTHSHGDHVNGIDDIKPYLFRQENDYINIYSNEQTLNDLNKRFHYLFSDNHIYKRVLNANALDNTLYQTNQIQDIDFIPFE